MNSRARPIIRGLYAITPDQTETARLIEQVSAALEGGIDVLQYRSKHPATRLDAQQRLRQAQALKTLTDAAGIPLIINDDVALALAVQASGVHIGAEDGDPGEVRQQIGPDMILGVSCYNRFEQALQVREHADYVAFGSVFASATKPAAVRAPLELFERARREGLQTVAIGGIEAGNAAQVLEAGADAVAVISDIFSGTDPRAGAARLAAVVRESSR